MLVNIGKKNYNGHRLKKGKQIMKSIVLCYNLKGTKKGKQIAMIFGFLGYKVRHVDKDEYGKPIGVLTGLMKEEEDIPGYTGEDFESEMLVMSAATENLMDQALFLMRKDKIKVDLKAMVTSSNVEWTSLALYEEIQREHQVMKERERNRRD